MKKIRIILLILVMFLFGGCSVHYDLSINEDLTVNEKVTAVEATSSLKTKTGQDPKVAANAIFESYKIDGIKYIVSTTSDSSLTTTISSASFDSLEEYEEYFKSDIVEKVKVIKNGNYITLKYKQAVPLNQYASKSLIYDSIRVNIDVPFKVTENNADSANGHIYTWNITKDGQLKEIKITFNKNETDSSKKFNFLGFFEINVKYSILLVVGLIVIILAIVGIVYVNNKKNNRF